MPIDKQTLDDATAALRHALTDILEGVYKAGELAGRTQVAGDFQKLMSHAMGELASGRISADGLIQGKGGVIVEGKKAASGRAQRGSAKPAVMEALRLNTNGMTAKQAFENLRNRGSDIQENTVRGTLNKLRADGVVIKNGDQWILKETQPVPAHWATAPAKEWES